MSIENVGFGKLPNVYFEKITLEDHDEKSFAVFANLAVLDELEDSRFIWSSDELVSGFLKIALIETSNPLMFGELTNGESLHPSTIKSSKNWDERTKIHTYGYADFYRVENVGDKCFKLRSLLTKPKDTTNLFLFAYAYVDHKELSNHLSIKLTGLLSKYMGPVSSEIVMQGGLLAKKSNIFKKGDGTVYSGPVHQLEDEWYSESKPSETSIDLKKHTVKNSKLVDFRTKNLMDRSSAKFQKLPLISEAHYSFNSEADLFGVFSIDAKNIVLSKTKFGKAIYGLNEDLLNQVIDSLKLNSAEVYRRQVRFKRQTNRLGTPMYSKVDVLPKQMVASMSNLITINAINNNFVRTYSFSDFGKNEGDRGEFVYEVKLTFIDKTQDVVEKIIKSISLNINGLKDVVRRINSPNNYDYNNNSLRDGELVPDVLDSYIEDYYRFLALLKDIGETDLQEMINSKKSSFDPSIYKTNYGLKFIGEYEKIYSTLQRRFGVSPKELKEDKAMPSHGYPPNIIEISKTFEGLVKFDDVESSYDVLGVTDNKGILTLEREQMESRANLEITRFFDTSKSISSDDTFDMDNEDSQALRDLGASKMNFMSPLNFQFQGEKMSTEKISDVDTDKISMKFVKSKIKKQDRKVSSRSKPKTNPKAKKVKKVSRKNNIRRKRFKKNRFKFNFKPFVSKINQVKRSESDYIESSEYLGNNSKFPLMQGDDLNTVESKDTTQTNLRFQIANQISVKRSKKQFDLTENGSLYEKLKSSKQNSSEKLRKLPLSFKALFNSRSNSAKNNILEADSDILKNVQTKVATEIIFHANQKIEALEGYETNANGDILLSKPIWSELTPQLLNERQEVLCKMSYVEDPSIGIETAEEFKLPVLNSVFIVKGSGTVQDPNSLTILPERLQETYNIRYATTNVVVQPGS